LWIRRKLTAGKVIGMVEEILSEDEEAVGTLQQTFSAVGHCEQIWRIQSFLMSSTTETWKTGLSRLPKKKFRSPKWWSDKTPLTC
jgi:hypothetical protein